MTAALRLGLRLAGGGAATGSSRLRSIMVTVAAAVGAVLMLGVLAIAHTEAGRSDHGAVSQHGVSLLLTTVVVTVALPVLVLAATAGRLAAAMRDRRLANLRLLGMTAGQTRVVAAVETGVAAVVGTVLGWLVFLAARPLLVVWRPVGRHWELATLTPTLLGYVVALLAVPAAVTLVSASPARGGAQGTLATARRADSRRPPWWRLVPLLVGVALGLYVFVAADPQRSNDGLTLPMFAAVIALGLGMVLVVPSFVRLVADLLVRRHGHPASLIAGRRLQDQPAGTSRLVAGLLIGLFIVTGARAVVVAFEQTSQYQAAVRLQTTGQIGTLITSSHQASTLTAKVDGLRGIRATAGFPFLMTPCGGAHVSCLRAVVGTCDQLAQMVGHLPACRDEEPAWLGDAGSFQHPQRLPFRATTRQAQVKGEPVLIPDPAYSLPQTTAYGLDAEVFLPRSTPGLQRLLRQTQVEVVAVARPGVRLDSLTDNGPGVLPGALSVRLDSGPVYFSVPDTSYYDFVTGLRQLVWAVAAVVLSVGLLAFAIGAIDRAMNRRAELVSLQLTGVSPRLLRRTQWIEAALPLSAGVVLAVGLGALAGATYLAFGTELSAVPWPQTLTLAGVSAVAAVAVAGLTVIAASPRIRPELIRTE